MTNIVKILGDIDFVISAIPDEWRVQFVAYEVKGRDDNAEAKPFFQHANGEDFDYTYYIGQAAPYLSGYVKWDGCSDWHFDQQEKAMLHACSREGLARFGNVMQACWDLTAELCPRWRSKGKP